MVNRVLADTEINTTIKIKAKRLVGSKLSVNCRVKNPIPLDDANNSANKTPKRLATKDKRMPLKKFGKIAGNKINLKVCHLLAPSERAVLK